MRQAQGVCHWNHKRWAEIRSDKGQPVIAPFQLGPGKPYRGVAEVNYWNLYPLPQAPRYKAHIEYMDFPDILLIACKNGI